MTIEGGFFESKEIDGLFDREYDAKNYQRRWADNVSDGVAVAESAILGTQNEVSTVVDTMNSSINVGAGWIQGLYYHIDDTAEEVTHEAADPTNPRIDRVVIEADTNEAVRGFIIKTVTGTPAASPVAPDLTREDILTADGKYQISLAQVLVPANVSTLNTATVTDERGDTAVCGVARFKLGILPPTGSDAITIVVDDSSFTVLTETDQQALDEEIDLAIAELNDSTIVGTGSIPTTGWSASTGTGYALEVNVALTGVTTAFFISWAIGVADQAVAADAELSNSGTVYSGGITFYANSAPATAIPFNWTGVK